MSETLQLINEANPLYKISVSLEDFAPDEPFPVSPDAIADAEFASPGPISFGTPETVSMGISGKTAFVLAPLWKEQTGADPQLVKDFGLDAELAEGDLMLAMDVGGSADVTAAGSFRYGALEAGGSLEAGTEARLVAARTYKRDTPAQDALQNFFGNAVLPGAIRTPPRAGDLVALEFGGTLDWSLNASAGYEIKGTPSVRLSEIALSEHYGLSVLGTLQLQMKLAGRFSVEVRRGDDHWAHVSVHRRRQQDLSFAADVQVQAQIDPASALPSGKELLEALLGLRAKNWLNLAEQIVADGAQIQTPADLTQRLDALAQTYLSRYSGKALSAFSQSDVATLLTKLQKVVASYRGVDQSAIALFDRYWGEETGQLLGNLQHLNALTSWEQLQGELPSGLWNTVQQLTGGDLSGWLLGTVPETGTSSWTALQERVSQALLLLQGDAHEEIRQYITAAKNDFGLDTLTNEIDQVDSPEKLVTLLSAPAKQILQRLIGVSVDQLNRPDLAKAFQTTQKIAKEIQGGEGKFFQTVDQLLAAAASQSLTLDINAAYQRSRESDALIDFDLRLLQDDETACVAGQKLMALAGLGRFGEVLARYQPDVVRLRQGTLTHHLESGTSVKVNVVGWHRQFQYQELYRVVVDTEQQIRPTASGMLNVFTTASVSDQHDATRKSSKQEQELHSNFTLRFLAETHNAVNGPAFDRAHQQYLIDVITGQDATYTSSFSDSATTPDELQTGLAMARYLGLAVSEAALQPVLPRSGANYGPLTFQYSVRYSKEGLDSLFHAEVSDGQIRGILCEIVVANFAGDRVLSPAAWLYTSDQVRDLQTDPNFLHAGSILGDAVGNGRVKVRSPIVGLNSPANFDLGPTTRNAIVAFFAVESQLLKAFRNLQKQLKTPHELADLEKSLSAFGDALNEFDKAAEDHAGGVSPEFAVFDRLIRLAAPTLAGERESMLSLQVGTGEQARHMIFQGERERVQQPALVGSGSGA